MEESKKNKLNRTAGRMFWGLLFIVSAVCLILGSAGIINFGVNIWMVVLGVLSVAVMIRSLIALEWFGVFMPAALMVTIFSEQIEAAANISELNIGAVWVGAALLSVGFSILFHRRRFLGRHGYRWNKNENNRANRDTESEAVVSARFGSSIKYLQSNNLKKVEIDCSFGDVKVYFTDAKLAKGGAIADIDVSFGAVELFVPKDWLVIDDMGHSFGDVEEKGVARNTDKEKILTLKGNISFSGVEVVYI